MLKQFFITIWRACTDVRFYRERLERGRTGEGMWYLFGLLILTSLVLGIQQGIVLFSSLPKVDAVVNDIVQAAQEVYPEDLVVTIQSGSLATNLEPPVVIDVPEILVPYMQNIGPSGALPHIVTIDPTLSIEDFPSVQSMILLTEHSAVFADNSNARGFTPSQYRVGTFPPTLTTRVDRALYDAFIASLLPFAAMVRPIVIVVGIAMILILPIFVAFIGLWLRAALFFATGLLFFMLDGLLHRRLGFRKIYMLSFYGITSAVVYRTIESLTPFQIPWIGTILFLGTMVTAIASMPKRE